MDNQNFITAVVLSILIIVGFHYMYEKPQAEKARIVAAIEQQVKDQAAVQATTAPVQQLRDRAQILKETERLPIETPELRGSINLKGARLDDLDLINYRETVEKDSSQIVLLSPAGSIEPHRSYYASFGWLGAQGAEVPGDDTVWKADSQKLTPDHPVVLHWDNGKGLLFERKISIDDHFLFTVEDSVKNTGGDTVTLYPFGLIARQGHPKVEGSYVLHEGPLGVLDGTLKEIKYDKLVEERKTAFESQGGWLGITDKYWLVTLLPEQDQKISASFSYTSGSDASKPVDGIYQVDFRGTPVSLAPGASSERTTRLFAGAKQVRLLDSYAEKLGLPLFDRAIDFGWYYYLTKPFLYLLDSLSKIFGHMWIAIIAFTIMLKIVTLPLSIKSMRSMAKLKELQPELKRLQERYKDDKQKFSIATMELYQRERVNPMSGCFPILIQIPIFFALYKVLYVGIEMRHAPLFGWVHDMSAPDPTSVLTLFGLIDWSFIPHLGVWPILMGVSMFVQQKMSPQPPDKNQAQMFMLMPILFTFMMGQVAAGLIFYWTISNLIGIGQQRYVSMHVHGHKSKKKA
ncbi:MAG: membrane protein insertase YidC [Proteobacteria bacterium]|jgi:YidC/Oxa1 family membrane protein insertase|nr:membrane protein insertase YidC [Alphaproteobacteria bacterium]NCC03870.1 membrane protein insertase YidC [Pseudomonadota bacterium]